MFINKIRCLFNFHNWENRSDNPCIDIKVCRRCEKKEQSIAQHRWSGWEYKLLNSCQRQKTCKQCGKTEQELKPSHIWEEWKFYGYSKSRTCQRCSSIDAHNPKPESRRHVDELFEDELSSDQKTERSLREEENEWTEPLFDDPRKIDEEDLGEGHGPKFLYEIWSKNPHTLIKQVWLEINPANRVKLDEVCEQWGGDYIKYTGNSR